jgi:hypothetical protein
MPSLQSIGNILQRPEIRRLDTGFNCQNFSHNTGEGRQEEFFWSPAAFESAIALTIPSAVR